MQKKINVIFFVMIGILFIPALEAHAKAKHGSAAKEVDRNKDGVIDQKEWRIEKRRQQAIRPEVDAWAQSKADTNLDGVVDKEELAVWQKLIKGKIDSDQDGIISPKEKRTAWKYARTQAKNEMEKRYDKNGDGWLEPAEVKMFLKDKYSLIAKEGKIKVDSLLEKEYDQDNNGILDAQEVKALQEDLQ